MDFHTRMQIKLARRRQAYQKVTQCLGFLLLLGVAFLVEAALPRDTALVRETYTVRPGDTLRGISERYLAQTGSRSYILEFEQRIRESNPWLEERHGLLLPGDQLVIRYETRPGQSHPDAPKSFSQ